MDCKRQYNNNNNNNNNNNKIEITKLNNNDNNITNVHVLPSNYTYFGVLQVVKQCLVGLHVENF
jgi:hypothetical protein